MKKVVPALLLLVITLAGNAQTAQFSAQTDTNRILIGEQLTLSLRAEVPKESEFTWPVMADTIQGLEIVAAEKIDTNTKGQTWTILQNIRLTSFDSGYTAIPPLDLAVNGEKITSPAIAIEVAMPPLSEQQEMYDIKEPLEPPFNWLALILWAAGLLLLAALVFFLVRWLSKRKKQEKLTPEQRLSPYEYAQLQLKELEKEQLWQAGKTKEYYSRLTDILRLYLERQMHINAMESTADEVIRKVQALGLPSELNLKVAQLMHLSALVKYAKEKPGAPENERSLATVKDFLEHTKPAEEMEAAEKKEQGV